MIPCGEGKNKFPVSVGGAVVRPGFAGVFSRERSPASRCPGDVRGRTTCRAAAPSGTFSSLHFSITQTKNQTLSGPIPRPGRQTAVLPRGGAADRVRRNSPSPLGYTGRGGMRYAELFPAAGGLRRAVLRQSPGVCPGPFPPGQLGAAAVPPAPIESGGAPGSGRAAVCQPQDSQISPPSAFR